MKYLVYIRSKQFTHALACLSPKVRYFTVRRRWYALRLGLYHTTLQHASKTSIRVRHHKVVTTIAAIKRQTLTREAARSAIEHILYHKRYARFHPELIKETVAVYPDVIYAFLKKDEVSLASSYYQGLNLALLHQYQPAAPQLKDTLDTFLSYNSQTGYADKHCLYNNIVLQDTVSKLANLNQILAYHKLTDIAVREAQAAFTVTNLGSASSQYTKSVANYDDKIAKVTVIVTTYNASATISSCIDSLMQQSWSNIEVIAVDDASTDDTLLQLQHLSRQYATLKVVALPKNIGTFAAKSIGAEYATSEYLTCQDSDDWAHPQKIAEQVQPLIEDTSIIATTSHWLRLDHDGQYYIRQLYPFMRQNPASPMFRLQTVKQETGLWHIVRTGADSEFFERLKLVYGSESIVVIKKPLTIASHRPNSLMTSEKFGIYNRTAALTRLDYWEAWRLWHIDTLHKKACLVMASVEKQANASQALFVGIPDSIQVDMLSLKESLDTHTVLSKL